MITGKVGRLQCAAITNGCMNSLTFPLGKNADVETAIQRDPVASMLALNGWHLDHGRWVCGNHERTAPCKHQDNSGRLLPPYA
jgi:hypothetical protein